MQPLDFNNIPFHRSPYRRHQSHLFWAAASFACCCAHSLSPSLPPCQTRRQPRKAPPALLPTAEEREQWLSDQCGPTAAASNQSTVQNGLLGCCEPKSSPEPAQEAHLHPYRLLQSPVLTVVKGKLISDRCRGAGSARTAVI